MSAISASFAAASLSACVQVGERNKSVSEIIAEHKSPALQMVFIMLTDILNESSELICLGKGADEAVEKAFYKQKINK